MSGVTDRIFRAFLSTLSLRRATCQYHAQVCAACISIHALLAESDAEYLGVSRATYISIHALLAESDAEGLGDSRADERFLSTLSLRRATASVGILKRHSRISIHALLAESDPPRVASLFGRCYFYPRSPCGERRRPATVHTWRKVFLSTLSLRRATYGKDYRPDIRKDFYPRSPCGERHDIPKAHGRAAAISIHALLAESDWASRTRWELGM